MESIKKKYIEELEIDENEETPNVSKTWLHSMARSRPLILIHFLELKSADGEKIDLPSDKPVSSIGILFPGTQIHCKPRMYQASVRLIELLKTQREQLETDEDIEYE
jgi:hypothetical protein